MLGSPLLPLPDKGKNWLSSSHQALNALIL